MAPKKGTDWAIRITRSYDELDGWVQHLADKCERAIAYEHEADEEVSRTHVHLVIIGYSTSDETMKAQIRKHFNTKTFPKTDWVFDNELRDERKAITYASKKDLQAKFNKGYEATFVAECSAEYLPPDEYAKKGRGKTQYKVIAEKPEVSKKRQNDLLDEMIKRYKSGYPMDKYLEDCTYPFKASFVVNVILEVLNEHRVIFGRYKVRDYFDTICARMWTSRFQNIMEQTMIGFVTKDNLAYMT